MGQIISKMTGVVSPVYSRELNRLESIEGEETPYESVKAILSENLKKPMKEIFDGFQTKPFKVSLFWQTHRSILLENYK